MRDCRPRTCTTGIHQPTRTDGNSAHGPIPQPAAGLSTPAAPPQYYPPFLSLPTSFSALLYSLLSILYLYLYFPPSSPSPKMAPIERITLFNIPSEADQNRVLEQYKVLAQTARKVRLPLNPIPRRARLTNQDGKPYILNAAVGRSVDDPRNKGFNISVKTTFASMDDMQYYDTECEAHKALKAVAGPVKQDVLTTFYENIL